MAEKKAEVQSVRNSDDKLSSWELGLSDGRTVTVDAADETTARRLAREQGGNAGVLSAKKVANPDKAKPTDEGDKDDGKDGGASSEEGGNKGGDK